MIQPQYQTPSGLGILFMVVHQIGLLRHLLSQYLGMFNETDNDSTTNHGLEVELGMLQHINDNYVGINRNKWVGWRGLPWASDAAPP